VTVGERYYAPPTILMEEGTERRRRLHGRRQALGSTEDEPPAITVQGQEVAVVEEFVCQRLALLTRSGACQKGMNE